MADALPNTDMLKVLIGKYYADGAKSDQGAFVSSHWQHYSQLFDVGVDTEQNLYSLSGVGFGTGNWNSRGHRFLDQSCILVHLTHLPHKLRLLRLKEKAVRVCRSMGLSPTFDVFRQVCSLDLLDRYMPDEIRRKHLQILMIGDGYGILGSLFKCVFPNSTIVMIDIGKTLLFQSYFCQTAHPDSVHEFVDSVSGLNDISDIDFVYCPTEDLEMLARFKYDLAVNIVSMQEMNPPTVSRYFTFLRNNLLPNNLFYCCNREYKTLEGGEVSEFMAYPWHDEDTHLVDQFCDWNRYFFSWGGGTIGPSILGVRVPIASFYDGPVRHRLSKLATSLV